MISNILQPYIPLVEFLGQTLGPDYEIVLQDLTPEHNCIIAIANGSISGRTVGSPLTNAALQMLSGKLYESHDFLVNYKGIAENGHVLRSSTMFIKDSSGIPVGLLCINFDDSRFMELHEKLMAVIHPASASANVPAFSKTLSFSSSETSDSIPEITEHFSMDIHSLMQKIFDDTTASISTPLDRLTQSERKELIRQLHDRGLFQLKGAISFVAGQFSCSSATIYRYLSEING